LNDEGTFFSNTDDLGHLLSMEQRDEVQQFGDWLFGLLDPEDSGCVRTEYFLERLTDESLLADVFEMLNRGLTGGLNMKMQNKFGELILCLEKIEDKLNPIKAKLECINDGGRRNSGFSVMTGIGMANADAMSSFNGMMKGVNKNLKLQKNSGKKGQTGLLESPKISIPTLNTLSPMANGIVGRSIPKKSNFSSMVSAQIARERIYGGIEEVLDGDFSSQSRAPSADSKQKTLEKKNSPHTMKKSDVKLSFDARTHANFGNNLIGSPNPFEGMSGNQNNANFNSNFTANKTGNAPGDSCDLLSILKNRTRVVVPVTSSNLVKQKPSPEVEIESGIEESSDDQPNWEELYKAQKRKNQTVKRKFQKKLTELHSFKNSVATF
jgi:hypothetical protein